ncbi:MAG: GNAT family N-acetyltransferase [Mobilitalea sp.]
MLSVITINEIEKWDSIVKSFPSYDVNYLSGYAKAFQQHGDGEPLLFYYNDNNTRAMNVVMKRDISQDKMFMDILPINTYFDLSTPYGYGGFWIEGDAYTEVNEAYDSYCRENGFVCEFVRFHLFSEYQPCFNGLSETHTHNVVRSLEIPLEEMLMDFEHKVRKNIKKAEKAGLEVRIDTTGERLDEFLDIYYGTMDRTEANKEFFFTKDFFQTLNTMEDNYVYIHVIYEEKIISTELVLYGTENCYSFLGGTNRDYFDLRPNDFLKYEIIKWAKEKGLKQFVLGGGYGEDDGIFKYKKSLAPNGICDYYIGKKIFNENKYNELLDIRKKDKEFDIETRFFPKYRG